MEFDTAFLSLLDNKKTQRELEIELLLERARSGAVDADLEIKRIALGRAAEILSDEGFSINHLLDEILPQLSRRDAVDLEGNVVDYWENLAAGSPGSVELAINCIKGHLLGLNQPTRQGLVEIFHPGS